MYLCDFVRFRWEKAFVELVVEEKTRSSVITAFVIAALKGELLDIDLFVAFDLMSRYFVRGF